METIGPTFPAEFARLYPSNKTAAIAFDQVASKLKDDTNWNQHARKYITIHSEKSGIEYYGSESESEGGSGPQRHKKPVWRGYYELSFDVPPRDPRFGWVLGGGKYALPGDESPELVLTERKSHDNVFGRHARLFHNHSSGALMLHLAKQSFAVVDGKKVSDSTTIWSDLTHITFGALSYQLQLDGANDSAHRGRLTRYQKIHGLTVNDYPVNLLSTPAKSDYIHKDYVIKNAIGHGSSSTVFAGEHIKSGNAVAIKRMTRTRQNAGPIEREIQMTAFLGRHHSLCHLIDGMSPNGDRRGQYFRNGAFDEVYLIYSPLVTTTWFSLCEPGPTSDAYYTICTKIFWQCLEGIDYIHSKGVIHRDIRPGSLAVVSWNPPQCRVINFGSAQMGINSNDVNVGTTPYCAPEMWRLSRSGKTSGLGYNEKADMFAVGVSAYQIFCKQPLWWGHEADEYVLDVMKADLKSQGGAPLDVQNLIRSLLADDAELRPCAKDARKSLDNWHGPENQG